MTMADTVAVMNRGRIEQMGSPAELYELPRTAFVANFLGQSNLVAGTVVESSPTTGLLGVDVGGSRILVPAHRSVRTRGDVLVGVRPEKLRLLVDGQEPGVGENVLGPGTVSDVSFMGVSTQYQVDVPGLGTFGVFAQNLLGGSTVAPGAAVHLAWSADFTFALDGADAPDEGTVDLDDEP
jgi:spermidine/putrescine transport system ATP-binding protein